MSGPYDTATDTSQEGCNIYIILNKIMKLPRALRPLALADGWKTGLLPEMFLWPKIYYLLKLDNNFDLTFIELILPVLHLSPRLTIE
jgi:hypothetical protein